MTDPAWITIARKYVGTTEVHGPSTAPLIRAWLISLKAWWTDDETPWCGTFVAACMKECGIPVPTAWFRARDWLTWGIPLHAPVVGCVVIYHRIGGGHVGFVVGRDEQDRILTLGGNQGDRVSIAPFDRTRALGYRWPASVPVPTNWLMFPPPPLPLLASNGQPSSHQEV